MKIIEFKALSTLSPKTATVAELGDSRRFLPQSPFSATVAVFCDSRRFGLLPKSATIVASRQCGQAISEHG